MGICIPLAMQGRVKDAQRWRSSSVSREAGLLASLWQPVLHFTCRCISRQLWWGHRIPAYKVVKPEIPAERCNMSGEAWVAARSEEEAKSVACETFQIADRESVVVQQDEDVLDTWFSSGLFPFSVFGWPEETEEFKAYFPTTLLETGLSWPRGDASIRRLLSQCRAAHDGVFTPC